MTIGQRISALRKERRLSQEELGAQLGVSRQAIYKWESDASLPDIDKLIALSRLFGLSVGALLGVEETANTAAEDTAAPAKPDGELTEAQLRMVEEIVARYIAAQPKAAKKKGRIWLRVAIAAVVILAFGGLLGKLNQVARQYNALQNSINNVQYTVNDQIDGISDRVEAILKSQNELTASYSTDLLRADPAAGTVTFSLRAVPKTYVPGMSATFSAASPGSDTTEVPGVLGSDQEFSAELTCPLTDDITLSVVFFDGTSKKTQQLYQYSDLYSSSLPVLWVNGCDLLGAILCNDDKTFQLRNLYFYIKSDSPAVSVENGTIDPGVVSSIRVGLFKDQKLVAWAEPCDQPPNYKGFEDAAFYSLPFTRVAVENGSKLEAAAVVTDQYGRELVLCQDVFERSDDELIYADTADISTNPKDWTY